MLYTETYLDRTNGELVDRCIGNWITISEYGAMKGLGSRQIRRVLFHAGLLAPEGRHGHYRLRPSFVARGLGMRHDRPRKGYAFDVLSPACQLVLDQEWQLLLQSYHEEEQHGPIVEEAKLALAGYEAERRSTNLSKLNGHGRVLWLADHFPDLPQLTLADIAGVRQSLVSRHLASRRDRKNKLREFKKVVR